MRLGITSVTSFNKCPRWIVSSFLTSQYGFRVPVREGKARHPSKQCVVTWRHISSSCWLALISANLVTVAGIFPMTRFACCETSSVNCDSSLSIGYPFVGGHFSLSPAVELKHAAVWLEFTAQFDLIQARDFSQAVKQLRMVSLVDLRRLHRVNRHSSDTAESFTQLPRLTPKDIDVLLHHGVSSRHSATTFA